MTVNKAIANLLRMLALCNQLDRPALDRIKAAICGAIDRELAEQERRRVMWKLRNGSAAARSVSEGTGPRTTSVSFDTEVADEQLVMDVERAA